MSDKLFGLAGLGLDDLETWIFTDRIKKKRRQQPRPKK